MAKKRPLTDPPLNMEILPGMVCTMHMYSDRNVYLVDRISDSGKTVYIRRAARIGSTTPGERQSKWIPMTATHELVKVQRNKKGEWRTIADGAPCWVFFGVADPYYDRSF